MRQPVGIRSLAISLPSVVRTNDYWRTNYPELVTQAEEKTLAKLFSSPASSSNINEFDLAMAPYLKDPFRGTVERRVLGPGESSLTLEYRAAQEALAAAKLAPKDVDLILVASLLPEHIGAGNASFLARQLDLRGAAWNIESACASTLVAFQNACALVQTGAYRNVLVVISCTYSQYADENDTLSWFMGDGAGAFVVGSLESNQGILGTKVVHTGATCGTFFCELTTNVQGTPRIRMKTSKEASKLLRDTAAEYLRTCCNEAITAAGVRLEQIDFFVFNTPLAWYASFCATVLGIDPERTVNLYPQYANIGPALTVVNLYHAAQAGKIRENDLVLVYAIGSSSTACATVMRWGHVALGSVPLSHSESQTVLISPDDRIPALSK
jgi:3-oxoacyl-[acyl-carrier-protein] synthase-3